MANKHYFVLFNENDDACYISEWKSDLDGVGSNGWKVKGPYELRLLE